MRKIALLLALSMLLAVPAAAAQWPEGCSSAKPYEGVPAVDLETTMGYMLLFPRKDSALGLYCKTLFVYLPREDVHAGAGEFRLCAADGVECSFRFDNAGLVRQRPMTEKELVQLLWGCGTCFEISLPRSLTMNKEYHVEMDEGCIVAENGMAKNNLITNPQKWSFGLTGEFGVSGLYYRRAAEGEESVSEEKPSPGDELCFELVLGGEAKSAVLLSTNSSVDFLEMYFTQNATITGTVLTDSPSFIVLFMDEQGKELAHQEIQ